MLKKQERLLISVIVPVYNLEHFCPFCFDSLIAQTYKNAEYIVVNDGSTDNTLKVCMSYAEQDSRFKVFSQANAGVSAARNLGLEKAAGAYIAFVDGDDIVSPFYLERLMEMHNENVCLSMCSHERVFSYDALQIHGSVNRRTLSGTEAIKRLLTGRLPISAWGALFEKSRINNLQFAQGIKRNEDKLFLFEYILNNIESAVTLSDEKLYGYYVREGSATKSTVFKKDMSVIQVAEIILQKIDESYPALHDLAASNTVFAKVDFLKSYIRADTPGDADFEKVRREVLSVPRSSIRGKTLRVEYDALKLGDWAFSLLVKLYYALVTEKARFRKNERRVEAK